MKERKKNASKLELGLGENMMSLGRIVLGASYLIIAKDISLAIYSHHITNSETLSAIQNVMSGQYMVGEFAGAFLGATLIGPFTYAFGSDVKENGLFRTLFN